MYKAAVVLENVDAAVATTTTQGTIQFLNWLLTDVMCGICDFSTAVCQN